MFARSVRSVFCLLVLGSLDSLARGGEPISIVNASVDYVAESDAWRFCLIADRAFTPPDDWLWFSVRWPDFESGSNYSMRLAWPDDSLMEVTKYGLPDRRNVLVTEVPYSMTAADTFESFVPADLLPFDHDARLVAFASILSTDMVTFTTNTANVPEPSTLALAGIGLFAVATHRVRQRRRRAALLH